MLQGNYCACGVTFAVQWYAVVRSVLFAADRKFRLCAGGRRGGAWRLPERRAHLFDRRHVYLFPGQQVGDREKLNPRVTVSPLRGGGLPWHKG